MRKLTAAQLGISRDAHRGQQVAFTSQGFDHTGTLVLAFPSDQDAWTHIVLDDDSVHVVNDDVTVTVA